MLHPDGNVTGAGKLEDALKIKVLRKKIKEYARACAEAVPMKMPGAGDCLYCQMIDKASGLPLGEANGDAGHIHSHMDEGYVVPSLVFRALTFAGYDPNRQIIHALAFKTPAAINTSDTARDAVRRSVAKYLRRQLKLA
jgi:hypothetical protein